MKNITLKLSLLIFFQYGVIGTYVPVLTLYLKDYLGFSSIQAGVILSVSSIPSVLAPLFSAFIVDRIISSRKFLILCSIITSLLILILSFERSYITVLVTYFIYMLFLVPSLSLVLSLIFHYIEDQNSFAFIRSWGTVGWILTGCIISIIWNISGSSDTLPLAFQLSALLTLAVIYITYKLPPITIDKSKKITLIPHETIAVIQKKEVIIILLLVFLSSTVDKFISYGTPIFLNQSGIKQENMLAILSIGQLPEILLLFIFSFVVKKLGLSRIMVIAFLLQITRFFIFYLDGPIPLSIFGSSLHGFIYPLFYAPATMFLDKFTDNSSRAGVHQIYNLIFVGLAGLVGNFLAGLIAESFTIDGGINFKIFWSIPGIISGVSLIILVLFIRKYNME